MFHFHKSTFFKLYRYYLRKTCWTWLIYLALMLVLSLTLQSFIWDFRLGEGNIWNETWKFCLLKLIILFSLGNALTQSLVWEATKKEDGAVLTTASPINRQNILLAKLASCFTYYWITNFGLNLPILWLSASQPDFTWITVLTFLLFDSFCLAWVIFLLFYTPFFYYNFPARHKKTKFLVFLLYFLLLFGFAALYISAISGIFKTPWIPLGLSLPIGGGFLSLYWNDFRQHNYT